VSLPYWHIPSIPLFGPLEIQPFGVMVALGVIVGAAVSWRKARSLGVDEDTHRSLVGWVLITGFLGAHIFEVVAYQPREFLANPSLLLTSWGISSYGGIFGALVGFWYFTGSRKVSRLAWGDIAAYGVVPGWIFGRAGCAIVHDHPGRESDFFLAIDFPPDAPYVVQTLGLPPGPRHDLGFYEFLYWLVIAGALYVLTRKPKPTGFAIAFVALAYAPVRFFLEYLRVVDPRALGLTPAQYSSMIVFAIGVALMIAAYRQRDREHPAMPPRAKPAGGEGAKGGGKPSAGKASAGKGKRKR
jgi:phosphatidylglycerol---prolipoprotein diacylglyceryl transferase